MTEDERKTAAIYKFYDVYRELQKYEKLHLHTKESLYTDALIEVHRYTGEKVLRVSRENTAEAYEQATYQVEHMLQQAKQRIAAERREHENGQNITDRSGSHYRRVPAVCTCGYADGAASYRGSR